MPKLIGIMCVKDEADLLPQVLPHVRERVDHLYIYEDGSQDNTWDLVKDAGDYVMRRQNDHQRALFPRGNYHHLLERIKKDFKKDETWVVITMGDRFFLNQSPREMTERFHRYDVIEGIQLDFLRHRIDGWTKANDPYPNYENIRKLCRWFRLDEHCIVAYRLHRELSYTHAKYPWPQGMSTNRARCGGTRPLDLTVPFLEHQGRRSPKGAMHRLGNGWRPISVKYKFDPSSFKSTMETMARFYSPYRVFPWIDVDSLKPFIEFINSEMAENRPMNRAYFRGQEALTKLVGLPPRRDI